MFSPTQLQFYGFVILLPKKKNLQDPNDLFSYNNETATALGSPREIVVKLSLDAAIVLTQPCSAMPPPLQPTCCSHQ